MNGKTMTPEEKVSLLTNALTRFIRAHSLSGPREDSFTKGIVDIYEFEVAEKRLAEVIHER